MSGFTKVASEYERTSLVQRAAAETLFKLIPFTGKEDVLDVGCASGAITAVIRGMTGGRVVGTDVSDGMIEKAKSAYAKNGIEFFTVSAEDLAFKDEFDVVFCNSTFQWFSRPLEAARAFLRALRGGGKAVMQAPATRNYSPVFLRAMEAVLSDSKTGPVFSTFRPPWFFLDTSREYQELFEKAGFVGAQAEIRETISKHSAEEAFGIFSTGAMVGCLDPGNYGCALSESYVQRFKEIVSSSFRQQADGEGKVTMRFFRIFLSARRKG